MKKGDIISIKIEGINERGKSYGIIDNNRVFVNINAAKDQIVEGRLNKTRKKRYELNDCKIIDYANRKNQIYQELERQCGGCNFQYYTYEEQLYLKKENIKRLLDQCIKYEYEFQEPIQSVEKQGYRNKMEFSFGNEYLDGPTILGLHKQNSFHDIVNVSGCKLMDANFNMIYNKVDEISKKFGLNFYHRLKHVGYLRNLVIRKGKNDILVNLVTTSDIDKKIEKDYLEEMKKELLNLPLKDGYKITGILHTLNDGLQDMVVSEKENILYGKRDICEEVFDLKFEISPYSFFQTNKKTVEKLYSKVIEYIGQKKDRVVFDLFSGTGTIGQIVSKNCKKVIGIEIVEEAVEKAKANCVLNNIQNCEFIAGDVFSRLENLENPDLLILDPPRGGVGEKTVKKIVEFYPTDEIIYVSCNPRTLCTDLKQFQEYGYTVKKTCIVDMFPFTNHVETVALLSKLNTKYHLDIEIGEDELLEIDFSKDATYGEIKKFVLDKYGLKVSSLYIAQVKRKHGIIERENYNISKKENQRVLNCPEDKEKAIENALEYFGMI